MTILRIHIKDITRDITELGFDDSQVMQKYGLNPFQLIFVLGKLADQQYISSNRMFTVVEQFIKKGNLKKAEWCLEVIRKYFHKKWMILVLADKMKSKIIKKKKHVHYLKKVKNSKLLKQMKTTLAVETMHPEILRMLKTMDTCFTEISLEMKADSIVTDSDSLLKRIKADEHLFSGLNSREANRMWHYVILNLLAERGAARYSIVNVADPMICDTCMHTDNIHFDTQEVLHTMNRRLKAGHLLSERQFFPAPADIENLPTSEKQSIMMKNDWYLPPFCPECRCQIIGHSEMVKGES